MKLFWGSDLKHVAGNAYGYEIHNNTLKKYVEKIYPLEEKIENATDAVYILPPELFEKVEKYKGVRTWLFTMFEGTIIPKYYLERIAKADYFLTPSTWVKELLEKHFAESRIFVVNHGVEPDFKFKKRKFPKKKPFRYLWIGAPNPRKGYEEILVVWQKVFMNNPRFELYIKSTRLDEIFKKRLNAPDNAIIRMGNILADGRDITRGELVKLYQSAHCFLFPTRGEGFGLTLAEAMRTGCPCIATEYSGVTDFFNDKVGYTLPYDLGEGVVTFIGDKRKEKTEIAYPSPDVLVYKMIQVYDNYNKAVKVGISASRYITSFFQWELSARKLIDIISGAGN